MNGMKVDFEDIYIKYKIDYKDIHIGHEVDPEFT